MPIHEYQCSACQHQMEILQKPTEAALTQCPECKQDELRKLISAVAFQLKGTGWYETDFKNTKNNEKTDNNASDKQSESGSETTKKETPKTETAKTETAKKETTATESKPATPNHTKNSTTNPKKD